MRRQLIFLLSATFLVAGQISAQDTVATTYKSVLGEGVGSWNVCYLNPGGYETRKVDISRDDTISIEGPAPDKTQPKTPSSCLNASII